MTEDPGAFRFKGTTVRKGTLNARFAPWEVAIDKKQGAVNFQKAYIDNEYLESEDIQIVRNKKFEIKPKGPEKRSVVDATAFFLSDRKELDPTENNPMSSQKVKKTYKKDLSYISGAKSIADNFSVEVKRSFTYEAQKKDVPLTVETVTSFLLLPEEI